MQIKDSAPLQRGLLIFFLVFCSLIAIIAIIVSIIKYSGESSWAAFMDEFGISGYIVLFLASCLFSVFLTMCISKGHHWTITMKGDSKYDYIILDQNNWMVGGLETIPTAGLKNVTVDGPEAICLQILSYSHKGTLIEATISKNGKVVAQAKEYINCYATDLWNKANQGMNMMKLNSPGYKLDSQIGQPN